MVFVVWAVTMGGIVLVSIVQNRRYRTELNEFGALASQLDGATPSKGHRRLVKIQTDLDGPIIFEFRKWQYHE